MLGLKKISNVLAYVFIQNTIFTSNLNVNNDTYINNDLQVNNKLTVNDVFVNNQLDVNTKLIVNNNFEYSNIDTFISEYIINEYWKALFDGVKNLANNNYYSPSYTTTYDNVFNDSV